MSTSDPRASRLRHAGVALLVPAGAVVAFDLAIVAGAGWQILPVSTALAAVAATLAGLSLTAVCVARGLDAVVLRRQAAARAVASAARPPLVPTPPRPAPVRPPLRLVDPPPEPMVPAGPGPLRPELAAKPIPRRVATQRTPEPHPVGYSP